MFIFSSIYGTSKVPVHTFFLFSSLEIHHGMQSWNAVYIFITDFIEWKVYKGRFQAKAY